MSSDSDLSAQNLVKSAMQDQCQFTGNFLGISDDSLFVWVCACVSVHLFFFELNHTCFYPALNLVN